MPLMIMVRSGFLEVIVEITVAPMAPPAAPRVVVTAT